MAGGRTYRSADCRAKPYVDAGVGDRSPCSIQVTRMHRHRWPLVVAGEGTGR